MLQLQNQFEGRLLRQLAQMHHIYWVQRNMKLEVYL